MRWPLRYQIMVPFAGAMLAVVVGNSLLDAYLAARRTQDQIERQLEGVAQTLLEATFPLTDAVLKQTRGLSGAEFLVTDDQGEVRASSLGQVELPRLPRASTNHARFALEKLIEPGFEQYFHTAIAVRPRGVEDRPMLLHILYPRRFLREARWQAAYPPLLVGGALLGVVIVLAIAIASRLSRPILELRTQLGRLVAGDFQPVPLPRRNDELRDLVGSANLLGDQLEESERALKRSERWALLGQLSGGLAHQLRNSVTGARIAVQLHGQRCKEIDPDSLAVALRQLSITESHLQRFLTVGQPSALRRGRCDLRSLVHDVAELVLPACNHHGVALGIDHQGDTPWKLWADADQLRQLLLNLALNGLEAAGPGGWVRIETTATAEATIVRVVDSGPGLSPRLRDRLFEPFATGKPDGIGLGLAEAKRIAEAHGGTIRCLPQQPTAFEIVLPQADPRDDRVLAVDTGDRGRRHGETTASRQTAT